MICGYDRSAGFLKRFFFITAGAAAFAFFAFPPIAVAAPDSDSSDGSGKNDTAGVQKQQAPPRRLVFEEQKIEGKIRRPQLVLIKADQRPEFSPMVLQSLGKTKNIVSFVDQELIERSPYNGAFQFEGTKIVNIAP